jgi:galactokinase
MRLARHRRLLDADDQEMKQRRETFASDVQRTLEAINVLQDIYDRPLSDFPMPEIHDSRSIA